MYLPLTPSPLQLLNHPLPKGKGVEVYLKRDDLIGKAVQGNKWRKLKYNIEVAKVQGLSTLLTFGGPYSNHLYATAAGAKLFGFKSIGVIRGSQPAHPSPTLLFAQRQGMQLHYVDRETYQQKDKADYIAELSKQLGPFYPVPEGGTNQHALKGVAEVINEIEQPYHIICTAVGTGGTLAGLVAGLKGQKQVLGFSALKGADTLSPTVQQLVSEYTGLTHHNFSINFNYHFGGYARITAPLVEFIHAMKNEQQLVLDPVYTGKMLYGLFDLIKQDYFTRGTTIVALHTGGLQGLCGYENYFPGWSAGYFD